MFEQISDKTENKGRNLYDTIIHKQITEEEKKQILK
jgi:hypothetical protein